MLDLLSAMGTVEILQFIKKNPKKKSNEIHNILRDQTNSSLTTATIYRRLKELKISPGLVTITFWI